MTGLNCQRCAAASCKRSEPFLVWGLGPTLGPQKLLGISLLNQMDMYLFLKNYFLLKYQSIMHKTHNAMFVINVHFIMYNLYEPMKIK